jgi:hypothetical protein
MTREAINSSQHILCLSSGNVVLLKEISSLPHQLMSYNLKKHIKEYRRKKRKKIESLTIFRSFFFHVLCHNINISSSISYFTVHTLVCRFHLYTYMCIKGSVTAFRS